MSESKGRLAYMPEPGKIEFREYELPEPEPGAILVEVINANVCGSELHIWRGHHPVKRAVMGHEMVGRVFRLGKGVTKDNAGNPLKVGDRVVAPYFITCMRCRACRRGIFNMCENVYKYWMESPDVFPHFHGAFSTHYYIHPEQFVFKVPDEIPDKVAASANCAITQVYYGIDKINVRLDEVVVVQGCGGLGLSAIAILKERGATVIAVDGVEERLQMAKRFGADYLLDMKEFPTKEERVKKVMELTEGWGADVAIELAGVPDAFAEGVLYLHPGGRYLQIGNVSPDLTTVFAPGILTRRSILVLSVVRYDPWYLLKTLEFLKRNAKKYPFESLLDKEFSLDRVKEALDEAASRTCTRPTIKPNP